MATLNVSPPVAAAPVVLPDSLVATNVWYPYLANLATALNAANAIINAIPGVNVFSVATQPTLTLADAGYVGYVTDTNHFVRWTGATWDFMGGDESGALVDRVAAPASAGYALCVGAATTLLAVGATLTLAAFTTPNLTGTPAYKKSAAAYAGTINAKAGTTGTGTTGTGTTGTGTTGTGTTGTGTTGTGTTGASAASVVIGHTTTPIVVDNNGVGSTVTVSGFLSGNVIDDGVQTHSIPGLSVPGLSVPGLSVPGLSVPGLSVPALAVGSIEMANLAVLPYVRR